MIPNVALKRNSGRLAPASSLHELLVLPLPASPGPRPLRRQFLRDLSFFLPVFGAALGWLLLRGELPFVGATLFTICILLLTVRLETAWLAWRERQRLLALRRWQRRRRRSVADERPGAPDEQPAVVYIAVPCADAAREESYGDITSHPLPPSGGAPIDAGA